MALQLEASGYLPQSPAPRNEVSLRRELGLNPNSSSLYDKPQTHVNLCNGPLFNEEIGE